MRTLGHLYDEDPDRAVRTAGAFGWLMAAELRAIGVDMSFTPCVDLDLGLSEIIGDRALHSDAFTVAASLAGLPAVSVPCGRNAAGLPIGLQVIGPAFGEGLMLRVAECVERL